MERRIGLAVGIDPQRIVGRVGASVPAPDREVEAADESERAVDGDDLLMLRRAERQAGIETEAKAVRRARREFGGGIPFALRGVERREIPRQDVDPQFRLCQQQRFQERTEFFLVAILGLPGRPHEPGLAVDVPADDVDLPRRQQQRLAQGGKVCGCVVENRQPPCLASSPDGLTRNEDG
jgi:hypothetical protein